MSSPNSALLGRPCSIRSTGKFAGVCLSVNPSSYGAIAEIQAPSGKIVSLPAARLVADMTAVPQITGSGKSSPAAAQLVSKAEKAASDGMNKTERRYAEEVLEARRLSGEIRLWKAQTFRMCLADDTWYWPDFYCERIDADGKTTGIEIIEIKGFMREDARVKLKVAADSYRAFEFYLVFAEGRTAGSGWNISRVHPGPARSGEGSLK